jgi:two-component system, NarL family, nitrate/nitrite response regulator NarL
MLKIDQDVAATSAEQREIYVFIASPRLLVREAFQRLIGRHNLVVVGKGKTFAALVDDPERTRQLGLVIGIFDSHQDTWEALLDLKGARSRFAEAKVIVLTTSISPALLRAAVEASVEAILTTDISPMVLHRAIDLVILGQPLLPAEMAELLDATPLNLEAKQSMPSLDVAPHLSPDRKRAAALSPREQGILQQLVNGCSNKVIARKLNITEATVKVHVKALLRKTHMANRTQAAIWAMNAQVQSGVKIDEVRPEMEPSPRTNPSRPGDPRQIESLIDTSPIRVAATIPIEQQL